MVIEGAVDTVDFGQGIADASTNLITEVGKIGNWFQAVGLAVVIWIIVQVIIIIINRRNHNTIKDLKVSMERLEKKIDKLGKRK